MAVRWWWVSIVWWVLNISILRIGVPVILGHYFEKETKLLERRLVQIERQKFQKHILGDLALIIHTSWIETPYLQPSLPAPAAP
jgi:hypothetical protein